MIRQLLARLFRDDQGQDLTEYTLLIALVALVAFGLFAGAGNTAAGVWGGAGTTLTSANPSAIGADTGTTPAPDPGGNGGGGGGDGHHGDGDHDHH